MKSITVDIMSKVPDEISADLLSRTFPNRPDRSVFKKRDLPGFGYEIYVTRKDKTEQVVFKVTRTGPVKFPRIKLTYEEKLLTLE